MVHKPPRYKLCTCNPHAARNQSLDPASHASPSGSARTCGALEMSPLMYMRAKASQHSLQGASEQFAFERTYSNQTRAPNPMSVACNACTI